MFIRAVAAYDVSCLMEYKGLSLQTAMDIVVNDKLMKMEGEEEWLAWIRSGNVAIVV